MRAANTPITFLLALAACHGASPPDATPAPSLPVSTSFSANSTTISTSEGAPYGDCDFWVDDPQQCTTRSNASYGPSKVTRLYICLSGEVEVGNCSQPPAVTAPVSSAMLNDISTRLAAYAGTGMRVMVRFIYNFGPSGPTAMDAPINVISADIDALAPVVLQYKDLVFALEAGFIGTWGEWHSSTNGNDVGAAQKIVLDKELSYFGDAFPILVRYPAVLLQYLGDSTPTPNVGLHDDFYASSFDDGGTWNSCITGVDTCPTPYATTDLQTFASAVSTTTMFAGEFGDVYQALQTCDALAAYSYTYHPQSISANPAPNDVALELAGEGCLADFYNKVGTRIELQHATISGSASPSGQLEVTLTLVNSGYGRVIRPRPASIVFTSNNATVAQVAIPLADLDLRQLASASPAVPQTFTFNVALPANFPAVGNVSAALLIPDPAPSLGSQAAYALPLNSVDASDAPIFDPATGYNVFATFSAN